jgi:hypothetical protein
VAAIQKNTITLQLILSSQPKNEGPDQPPALYVGWPTKSKKD